MVTHVRNIAFSSWFCRCLPVAQADQDRKDREKQLKAAARNPEQTNRKDPAQQSQDVRRADDGKREDEIRRAVELKRKAEADLAAVAEAKAKLAAEAAKQREIKSMDTKANEQGEAVKLKSLDSKERIEAALLGALAPDFLDGEGRNDSEVKTQIQQQKNADDLISSERPDKTKASQKKSRLPQYDVIFVKDKKNNIDEHHILGAKLSGTS